MQTTLLFLLYLVSTGSLVSQAAATIRIGATRHPYQHEQRSLLDVTNPAENLAFCRETTQSSTLIEGYSESYKAVDGITDYSYARNYGQETHDTDYGAWWQVNLCAECCIQQVTVYNRFDVACPDQPPTYNCGTRLNGVTVELLDQVENVLDSDQHDPNAVDLAITPVWSTKVFNTNANVVQLKLPADSLSLHVAEVVVSPCEGTTCPCTESCNYLTTGNCAGFTCTGGSTNQDGATDPPASSITDPPASSTTDPPVDSSTSTVEPTQLNIEEDEDDGNEEPFFYALDEFCGDAYAAMNDCQQSHGCTNACMESFTTDCCGFDALPDSGTRCLTSEEHCGRVRECCPSCVSEAEKVMECDVLELCSFDCGSSGASVVAAAAFPICAFLVHFAVALLK